MERVSLREYGRRKGVSDTAVRRAIKAGRLVKSVSYDDKGRPCVDPALADQEWEKNTASRGDGGVAPPPDPLQEGPEAGAAGFDGPIPGFAASRAERELYLAKLAKLELEEKTGKLIDAEEAKKTWFKLARSSRDAMLAIPDRLAAELAAETNPFKVHERLTAEIRKAIEGLKDDLGLT